MKMTQEIEIDVLGAVQNLYKTFSCYPLRKHVEGCPCCVKNQDKRALESAPLQQLSSEKLSRYAFKALTTWGDREDLKHFLPRICELLLSKEGIGCDVEVVLGKLRLAEWESWPGQEQRVLRAFFHAGWRQILSQVDPRVEPDAWLCGLARAGETLTPYLDDWATFRANTAYQHLLAFIDLNQPSYIKRHSLANAFWPDSPEGVVEVCNWLTSSRTREQLETIYFENVGEDYAPTLADVIERLELIARF